MARFVEPFSSRTKLDSLVERWKIEALLGDGSLLFPGRSIWTIEHLSDFRGRLVDNPIYGTDETFAEKLGQQLDSAEPEVAWLACELIAVYLLFVQESMGPAAKRELLTGIADSINESEPPNWPELIAAMGDGIGNPGVGYNMKRDLQLAYLIDFAIRFKGVAASEGRADLLHDPWQLRDFADDVSEGITVREMRQVLLHLLRPNDFERISSGSHKEKIAEAFSGLLPSADEPEDLDERLFAIRQRLEALNAQPNAHRGVLDFYHPPLVGIWNAPSERDGGMSDLQLLRYKRQLILHGAPGTGKTHRTRELAAQLIRQEALDRWGAPRYFSSADALDELVASRVRWVQLHAGYGYEEFIRGLRLAADGSTTYVDGLLPRLVDEIDGDPEPEETRLPFVLVLDEINRTDLSRMFGEAFSLLENRDQPVLLPGIDAGEAPRSLALPKNLFVIGTMNLIDQSVEELDFALRRRFFWRPVDFDATPIVTVNRERWSEHAPPRYGWDRAVADFELLADRAALLNQEIATSAHLGPQYVLGQSYFFDGAFFAGTALRSTKQLRGGVLWDGKGRPKAALEDLWSSSIEPLLGQYLGGLDPVTAADELARLRSVLLTGS